MAHLHTARLNDQLMRLVSFSLIFPPPPSPPLSTSQITLTVPLQRQAVRDLQGSSETLDESLIELMRQVEEMARDIVLRVAEIERELALISAFGALENLRNLVREAGE